MRQVPLFFTLAVAAWAFAGPAAAQNLIPNGSFEDDNTIPACVQGVLPAPWMQLGNTTPGADAYSFDKASLPGFPPPAFGNFITITEAPHGLRFVAGAQFAGGAVNEAYGVPLVSPPVPGTTYVLDADFIISDRPVNDNPGHLRVWLTPTGTDWVTDGVLVGTIGSTAQQGSWTRDRLTFDAPFAASHLVLEPVSEDVGVESYLGTDRWVLREKRKFQQSGAPSTGGTRVIDFVPLTADGDLRLSGKIQLPAGVQPEQLAARGLLELVVDGETALPLRAVAFRASERGKRWTLLQAGAGLNRLDLVWRRLGKTWVGSYAMSVRTPQRYRPLGAPQVQQTLMLRFLIGSKGYGGAAQFSSLGQMP